MNLMKHQLEVVQRAHRQRRLAMFWDPGTGKTIAALRICAERLMPTLVLCPRSIIHSAWIEDCKYFGDAVAPVVIHGTPAIRKNALSPDAHGRTIYITTYETFKRHQQDFLDKGVRRFIVDESSKIKNRDSQITKAVIWFADRMDEVFLLSGTPAPNCPSEYWSQLRALDSKPSGIAGIPATFAKGQALFWPWAMRYLNPQYEEVRFAGGRGRTKRVVRGFKIRNPDIFSGILARAADRRSKEECLDLPGQQHIPVWLDLLDSEQAIYDLVVEDLSVDGFDIEATAAVMKMRQITGGHVKVPELDEWRLIGTTKLTACADIVEGLGTEPVIIWTQFHVEADDVFSLMCDMGRKAAICDGRTTHPEDVISGFIQGELNTIVAHPASLGHGVTLVRCGDRSCRYSIYYSLSYSYEQQAQSMDRIYRKGQGDLCVYYYLLARNTIDGMIRRALEGKSDVSRHVLKRLKEFIVKRKQSDGDECEVHGAGNQRTA